MRFITRTIAAAILSYSIKTLLRSAEQDKS